MSSARWYLLWWYLWIAPNALCVVALVPAFRRRCFANLPWFFFYLVYFPLQTLVAVALRSSPGAYARFMLYGVVASFMLGLAMIYELANRLVLSHSSLARLLKPLPRWSAAVLVMLATFVTAFIHPNWQDRVEGVAISLGLIANLIGIGLLLTLVLIARIVGISWRSLPAGVALGLGISDTVQFAGLVLATQAEKPFVGDLVQLGSWHVCVLVWLFYLFLPEKATKTNESGLRISELSPHSQGLQRMIEP